MIQIDFRSRVPIYEQLVEKIKELIIKGILEKDEKLPSVRSLSKDIGVNPNTIQKAYRELESQEYIYSIKGKGSYVMAREDRSNVKEVKKMKEDIKRVISQAIFAGVTISDIKEILSEIESEGGI